MEGRMTQLRLLTPAELAAREYHRQQPGRPGRRRSPERTRIIAAYKATLQQAHPGFGGEVVLARMQVSGGCGSS